MVTYRPAVFYVVGAPSRRAARHYSYEALGGLVLGGAASVAYRPAPVRRYAHVATGGIELAGTATGLDRYVWEDEVLVAHAALAIVDGDLVVLVPRVEDHLLILVGGDEAT